MKKFVLVLVCCLFSTGALAETKVFQLSLTPHVAIHSRTEQVDGFSLGLWSENPQAAVAIGLVNGSTGSSSGLSISLGNYSDDYKGAQIALLTNYSSGTAEGFYLSAVNYAERLSGLQLGLFNYAKTSDEGLQIGIVNIMGETDEWFGNFPDEIAPWMVLVNWRF